MASSRGPLSSVAAWSFRSRTFQSLPPTINSVGAVTTAQGVAGQIWPSPARHDCVDGGTEAFGRAQGRRRSGRGPEIPHRKPCERLTPRRPPGRVDESARKEVDVEHVRSLGRLVLREEIKQERREAESGQMPRDRHVARAEPAGPAPMHEDHQPAGLRGEEHGALQVSSVAGRDQAVGVGDRVRRTGAAQRLVAHLAAARPQQRHDLIVGGLREVLIPGADAAEARRSGQ